jgi:hypothetical protein
MICRTFYFEIEMDDQPLPTTFADLYRLGCTLTDDHLQPYIPNYQDLDNLRAYIDAMTDDKKPLYLHALSEDRLCIAIPYEMFQDKRLPPDSRDEDGDLLIFACPGYDGYVSDLIDQMKHDLENNPHGSHQGLTKWKLLRLGKMYRLGWDKFSEQYVAPLKNKEEYFMTLLKAGYGK